MNIVLDIETIPCQDGDLWAEIEAEMRAKLEADIETIKAPANYKDMAKIEEYIANKRADMRAEIDAKVESAFRDTALNGALGSIAVIGWAIDGRDAQTVYDPNQNEHVMLYEFMRMIDGICGGSARPCFIGHQIINFDLRFLWQRCVILDVKPSPWIPFNVKPWDERIYDTMTQWSPDREKRISLKRLCRSLGVPTSKGDLDGSKVWDYWSAEKYEEVAAYCRADVVATRECYRRMTFGAQS